MLVTKLEMRQDRNGKPFKSVALDDGRKFNVFPFNPQYTRMVIGAPVGDDELVQDGKFWKLAELSLGSDKETPMPEMSPPAQSARPLYSYGSAAKAGRDQSIKEAQERKAESIAYFNALNAAIALVTKLDVPPDTLEAEIRHWRDWFISEWTSYNQDKPPF